MSWYLMFLQVFPRSFGGTFGHIWASRAICAFGGQTGAVGLSAGCQMVPVGSWQLCLSQMKKPSVDVRAIQSKQTRGSASSRAPLCMHELTRAITEPSTLNLQWRKKKWRDWQKKKYIMFLLHVLVSDVQMMVFYLFPTELLWLWLMRNLVWSPPILSKQRGSVGWWEISSARLSVKTVGRRFRHHL